jgi:hypothetical protein
MVHFGTGKMIDSIDKLVDAFDGPTNLGKILGCTSQNISLWSLRKEIPTGWHYRLHLLAESRGLPYNRHKLFGIPKGFGK